MTGETMSDIFMLFFFLSLLGLVFGLINPRLTIRWGSKRNRARVWLTYGSALFVLFILIGITAPDKEERLNRMRGADKPDEPEERIDIHDETEWIKIPDVSNRATEGKRRVALIKDTSGMRSEVSGLRTDNRSHSVKFNLEHRFSSYESSGLPIIVNAYDRFIPFKHIISLYKIHDKRFQILYEWNGNEMSISGIIPPMILKGQIELGDFSISTSSIKQIVFKQYPAVSDAAPLADVILALHGGHRHCAAC